MRTSEVLRRVHTHLRGGEQFIMSHRRSICFAADYLYYEAKVIGDRDRTRVKKIITAMLLPALSLEDWLLLNHGIQYKRTKAYQKKIMATRKAWLDHLINHYEAKGD